VKLEIRKTDQVAPANAIECRLAGPLTRAPPYVANIIALV
jgi:hypothetical protein